MALGIMVLGKAGSGKSTSLRNLDPTETFIIKANNKELPFLGVGLDYKEFNNTTHQGNTIQCKNLRDLEGLILSLAQAPHIKNLVIDDFSHYITERVLSTGFIADTGFSKWNQLGADINKGIIETIKNMTREDLNVIVIAHTDMKEDGTLSFKSSGKLVDNLIDPLSFFTYTFHAMVMQEGEEVSHKFLTQFDGIHQAKNPIGIFDAKTELYIDNDLYYIIEKIRASRLTKSNRTSEREAIKAKIAAQLKAQAEVPVAQTAQPATK